MEERKLTVGADQIFQFGYVTHLNMYVIEGKSIKEKTKRKE